jgi:hypothetical protein
MLPWTGLIAVELKLIACRNLSSSGISLVGLSKGPSGSCFGLSSIGSLSLRCAALEVGALLDREGLVANVTDDMRLGFKHHITALNWTFNSTVHNDPLSNDTSDDLSIWRYDKRSATYITFYLPIDLD